MVTTANSAQRGGDDTVETVDLKGNADLIGAAVKARVRRFVFVSALGASLDSPVPFMAAKAVTETRLRESGMEWTILAPEAFMEVWLGMVVTGPVLTGGAVVYVGSGDRRHSFVSLVDVARFAIAAVDSPAAKDRSVPIAGPEAISFNDVAYAFERALGRPIPRRSVEPGVRIPGMPETVLALLTGLDAFETVVDTRAEAETFGVPQTSLDDYVASVVPVAV